MDRQGRHVSDIDIDYRKSDVSRPTLRVRMRWSSRAGCHRGVCQLPLSNCSLAPPFGDGTDRRPMRWFPARLTMLSVLHPHAHGGFTQSGRWDIVKSPGPPVSQGRASHEHHEATFREFAAKPCL